MRLLNPLLLSLFILTNWGILGCKKDSTIDYNEQKNTKCNTKINKTNIRIENASDYDFSKVIVDPSPSAPSKEYGTIKEGETTCYHPFDTAYSYAYIELKIGDDEFKLQPYDYVGERPLRNGKYTYSIEVKNFEERS